MYKKSVLHVQSCFFDYSSFCFFAVLVAIAVAAIWYQLLPTYMLSRCL